MKFSIVTTSYQSESTIEDFVHRINNVVIEVSNDFEIIVVDDGSTDQTRTKFQCLLKEFNKLKVLELSRNFGHHKALLAGLEHCTGEIVFLIDSDLEEMPELFQEFLNAFMDSGADVVYGLNAKNQAGWLHGLFSSFFWKMFRRYTNVRVPSGVCTVRLMSRRYVNALLLHKEVNVFLAGLWEITGFDQRPLQIKKNFKGSSSYTLGKRIDLALTSLISFSGKPLRIIAMIGIFAVLASLLLLALLISRFLVGDDTPEGWLSVITLLVFFGGLQIFSIGLVAIYVASILEEVKRRPRTIVSRIFP
jgi:putative glycosyltransferase